MIKRIAPLVAALGMAGAAQADTFHVTFEAPGVETSTAAFSSTGVETFDGIGQGGGQTFASQFGSGGAILGSYSGVDVLAADQYGGAGGAGNYASTFGAYSLSLSTSDPAGINYFGFWLSALDSGNTVTFSRAGSAVFSFSPGDVLALVGGNPAYFGNPDAAGANASQAYVFLNFFDTNGAFDTVTFSETLANAGYESDNHTVGFYTAESGTPVGSVPEPAAWMMMILGFGAVGAVVRRGVTRARPAAGAATLQVSAQ